MFLDVKNSMRLSVGFSKSQAIDDYYSGSWVAISSLVEAISWDQGWNYGNLTTIKMVI